MVDLYDAPEPTTLWAVEAPTDLVVVPKVITLHDYVGEVTLRLQCAWCGHVMRDGDPGAPTSHGMCTRCADQWGR